MADFIAANVCKQFPTPGEPLIILNGVSVELNRGENIAIVGPSGSGKSTFLHIAGTLDHPTSGEVSLLGTDLASIPAKQIASFRNQHIGFIFQDHHLLPQLTAIENVMIPLVARPKDKTKTEQWMERAEGLLEQVGLKDRQNHRPAQLSGGERQRVAVARALICQPELVLADEPTGSLDGINAEKIGDLLLNLQRSFNTMLICVTHSDKLASQFDRKFRLEQGKFV